MKLFRRSPKLSAYSIPNSERLTNVANDHHATIALTVTHGKPSYRVDAQTESATHMVTGILIQELGAMGIHCEIACIGSSVTLTVPHG